MDLCLVAYKVGLVGLFESIALQIFTFIAYSSIDIAIAIFKVRGYGIDRKAHTSCYQNDILYRKSPIAGCAKSNLTVKR